MSTENQNLRTKPSGWFSFFSVRPGRKLVFMLLFALFATGFGIVIAWLSKKVGGGASTAKSNKTADGPDWEDSQHKHELRALQQHLTHRAAMIQEDIDEFEREAKQYVRRFEELLNSPRGKALEGTENVVEYFRAEWQKILPKVLWASSYRAQINEYAAMSKEALQTKHEGFRLSQETLDEVEYIGKKAGDCASLCKRHNQLLDTLSPQIGEGPTADPQSIKHAVLKRQDELMMHELKTIALQDLESNQRLSLLPAERATDYRRELPPPWKDTGALYRKANESWKAETSSREKSEPLMRDTVSKRPWEERGK